MGKAAGEAKKGKLKIKLWDKGSIKRLVIIFIVLAGITGFCGCLMIWMPGRSYHGPLEELDEDTIKVREELKSIIQALAVDIGSRGMTEYPELLKSEEYITKYFTEAGYTVNRQEYKIDGVTCCNLEVELKGTTKPDEIIVIGAHYDTAYTVPGANDNTSGVATTLVIAKQFAKLKSARTVRFVAFVNEEPPYFQTEQMGSWVYAKRCKKRKENIVAMITPETIGYYSNEPDSQKYPPPFNLCYPSTGNFVAFVGNVNSGKLIRQCVKSFRKHTKFPSEGGSIPHFIQGVGWSDHWSFWQEGYPALMVTDTAPFRYEHYHSTEDTIDKICFDEFARVVVGLEKVILDLAGEAVD